MKEQEETIKGLGKSEQRNRIKRMEEQEEANEGIGKKNESLGRNE